MTAKARQSAAERTDKHAPSLPRLLNPGDTAQPGTPGTGENLCRTCRGTGGVNDARCPMCGGLGTIVEGIGGG